MPLNTETSDPCADCRVWQSKTLVNIRWGKSGQIQVQILARFRSRGASVWELITVFPSDTLEI